MQVFLSSIFTPGAPKQMQPWGFNQPSQHNEKPEQTHFFSVSGRPPLPSVCSLHCICRKLLIATLTSSLRQKNSSQTGGHSRQTHQFRGVIYL